MDARQPEQSPRRTVRENAATLSAVPLFVGFSKKHLQRLAAEADELTFDKREVIVEEGMLGETLFVVLSAIAAVGHHRRNVRKQLVEWDELLGSGVGG